MARKSYKEQAEKGIKLADPKRTPRATEYIEILNDLHGNERDAEYITISNVWFCGFEAGYRQALKDIKNKNK